MVLQPKTSISQKEVSSTGYVLEEIFLEPDDPRLVGFLDRIGIKDDETPSLQTVARLIRGIIPSGYFVRLNPTNQSYEGLTTKEGGLEVKPNEDPLYPARVEMKFLSPSDIFGMKEQERVALCLEYCQLLVSMLRTVGVDSVTKIVMGGDKRKHSYVVFNLAEKRYKVDFRLAGGGQLVTIEASEEKIDDKADDFQAYMWSLYNTVGITYAIAQACKGDCYQEQSEALKYLEVARLAFGSVRGGEVNNLLLLASQQVATLNNLKIVSFPSITANDSELNMTNLCLDQSGPIY